MGSMLLLLQTPHPHLSLPRGGIAAALVFAQTHHAAGGARKKHSACSLCRGAGAALVPPADPDAKPSAAGRGGVSIPPIPKGRGSRRPGSGPMSASGHLSAKSVVETRRLWTYSTLQRSKFRRISGSPVHAPRVSAKAGNGRGDCKPAPLIRGAPRRTSAGPFRRQMSSAGVREEGCRHGKRQPS
jgi:hypothetical protein